MIAMIASLAKPAPAFTRIELLACLTAVALLGNIIVSVMAISARRADRAACFNNLRQIGIAYSQFGLEDHSGRPPWRVTMSQGGNSDAPGKNNPFVQFSILSNSLPSPKHLADPGDARPDMRIANKWNSDRDGGLMSAEFRNRALSYWLGLQGDFRFPDAVLSGDRNLLATENFFACDGIQPVSAIPASTTEWTNAVHGLSGNLLLFDGSVRATDTTGARAVLSRGVLTGNGSTCALFPF
jgi:hypothetical protein